MDNTTSRGACTFEKKEGFTPPFLIKKKPSKNANAFYLKGSKYLCKAERDPLLARSPTREGYLIPLQRKDILDRYKSRFKFEEVYESILELPSKAQELCILKNLKIDQRTEKFIEISNRCREVNIPISDLHRSHDPSLHLMKRDYEQLGDEIQQIERDIDYHKNSPQEQWEDPIPLLDDLPPVLPLKTEMIPEPIRDWIMDIAERMQIPPDFSASSAIVVLGSLIGTKVGVHPKQKDDWLVYPNLWGAVVGRPSLLKSPAIAEVMKPLDDLVKEAIKNHQEEELLYEKGLMVLEAKKNAFKGSLKDVAKRASKSGDFSEFDAMYEEQDNFEAPEKPAQKRYKTEDGTVEKIGEILQSNSQGILIHRDELSGWLKSMDKYGREGDRAFYLEAWNGSGSFTVDRIGRGTLHIPALCLSLLGGIQPGPLASYVHQARSGGSGDDGLLQRFQMLVWPDAPTTWTNVDRFPNSEAKNRAYEVFRKLSELEAEPLRFSEEAQALFDGWRENLEKRLRSQETMASMESHLAKYRSLMPSLALIFYLVETIDKGESLDRISLESSQKAIEWCDYLMSHAKRLYSSAGEPEAKAGLELLKKIQQGYLKEGFTPRDVYSGRHWFMLSNRNEVDIALKELQDLGWVRVKTLSTGGRPKVVVYLHPKLRKGK
ncbi:hypothetical protein SCG7109_AB_00330 [Chlamydiales bacterium SCGC AG-110-M15]|nr:hypothetical protein SCG7109_AB_00330 [Chlamydiales bacterium SCGC AG-110-M15]